MATLSACTVSFLLPHSPTRPSAQAHAAAFPSVRALPKSSFTPAPPSLALVLAPRAPAPRSSARPCSVRVSAKIVLEPVGDGDTSHLGESVSKPGPISLEGDAFVLGRVGDRSDVVIGIPTVSGSHARIERKGEALVVTDLNSTNGTFLNEDRLRPGTPTPVPLGSILTFGDQHLAMFKVTEVIDAVDV